MSEMRWSYHLAQVISRGIFELAFSGRALNTRRVPLEGPVLLLSNHQSFLDPVLVALPIPRECAFMARDTLFKQPQFSKLIRYLNAFPVKRGTADVGAIKESLRRLKRGEAVVAFPEGTRTSDGQIGSMQTGAVLLARKSSAPIVPVNIHGAYEILPRDTKRLRSGRICVSYGQVISPDDLSAMTDAEAIEEVRRQIIAMQKFAQEHVLFGGMRQD
jgi:1-acyl-sn-glycerol-3-phosphate acyltransferase